MMILTRHGDGLDRHTASVVHHSVVSARSERLRGHAYSADNSLAGMRRVMAAISMVSPSRADLEIDRRSNVECGMLICNS